MTEHVQLTIYSTSTLVLKKKVVLNLKHTRCTTLLAISYLRTN
jgi:hypothetical protein